MAHRHSAGKAQPAVAGTQIGPYVLAELLGEGSFAHVYRAQQEWPLRRQVAVKVLKTGMDSKAVVARFEQERQTLARFNHPHISSVIDAGMDSEGRPYFVMEYVAGTPLTAYCNRHRLPVRQRLELFMQACSAVQYSHSQGVIHRDLKPANIIASGQPHAAVVKVIDFGIAKVIGPTGLSNRGATLVTTERQLIGTPEYMSPEQVSSANAVDTRSDTYALGAVLYELLTGLLPFDSHRLRDASMAQLESIICTEDPKPLAARLRQAPNGADRWCQEHFDLPAEQLERTLRGDLTWIALKALEKDPARRYQTPAELSDDIARYLHGHPVLAAPPSTLYLMHKFVRRRKGMVAAVAAVAVTLLGGALTTAWWAREATIRADESAQHLLRSEAARLASASMLAGTARPQLRALLAVESVLTSCQADGVPSSESQQALMDALPHLGGVPLTGHTAPVIWAEFSKDEKKAATASLDGTARVYDLTADDPSASSRVLQGHTAGLTHLQFHPSGNMLATSAKDGTVRIWNLNSAPDRAGSVDAVVLQVHPQPPLANSTDHYVSDVAWSPDGRFLAVACRDGVATIWDPTLPAQPIQRLTGHTAGITSVDWSPDGKRLLTYSIDHTAKVWLFAPDAEVSSLWTTIQHDGESWLFQGRFSSDGNIVYLDGSTSIAHRVSHQPPELMLQANMLENTQRMPRRVAPHPRSTLVALSPSRGSQITVLALDAATEGRVIATLDTDSPNINDVSYSPDGRWLAAACDNGAARVWSMNREKPEERVLSLRGHDKPVGHVVFSATGDRLLTCSPDGTARVWDLRSADPSSCLKSFSALAGGRAPDRSADFKMHACARGDRLLLVQDDGFARFWQWRPHPAPLGVIQGPSPNETDRVFCNSSALSADRSKAALLTWDRKVQLVRLPSTSDPAEQPQIVASAGFADRALGVGVSSSADRVAVSLVGSKVVVLDFRDGSTLQKSAEFKTEQLDVRSLAISPDGKTVATGGSDGTLKLYPLGAGTPEPLQAPLQTHEYVEEVAFSPDGRYLSCCGADSLVHLLVLQPDGSFGDPMELRGHTDWTTAICFHPAGSCLASTSLDGTVRVWNLNSPAPARSPLVLSGHERAVYGVEFLESGRFLATSDGVGTVRVWPIAPLDMCLAAKRALGRDMTEAEWDRAYPGKPYERTWERLAALESKLKGP